MFDYINVYKFDFYEFIMSIKWIDSVKISDGKGGTIEVKVGDEVHLLPSVGDEEALVKFSRPKTGVGSIKWMEEFLGGKGPYLIKDIGQWPCGGVNLYFPDRETGGSGPGASSREFYAEAN